MGGVFLIDANDFMFNFSFERDCFPFQKKRLLYQGEVVDCIVVG